MKLEFTGRHFTITPAIKKHAKEQFEKLEKILEGKKITSVHFILSVEKYRHQAELLVVWQDQSLSSTAITTDMYLALSQAVSKMERQALKFKDKLTTEKRKTRGNVKELVAASVTKEPATKVPRIVKSKGYEIKPMTPEEAVYDLVDIDDQFVVFRNSENNKVNVIYKKKDGNYGIIEI